MAAGSIKEPDFLGRVICDCDAAIREPGSAPNITKQERDRPVDLTDDR
jgi:hypothetical protein